MTNSTQFKRRGLLRSAGAAALLGPALPRPALTQPARARTIRFVPAANLSFLDPIFTTAGVTATHGFSVFDTLYGLEGVVPSTSTLFWNARRP